MRLEIWLFSLMVLLTGCNTKDTPKKIESVQEIIIHFIGRKYDQLFLQAIVWAPNHSSNIKFFKGLSNDGYIWTFDIPDSINQISDHYVIITEPFNFKSNTFYSVKFLGLDENDSSVYDLVYDENHPIVEATFLYTKQNKIGPGNYLLVNDTTIVDGFSMSTDVFKVNFKISDTELEVSMKANSFGSFNNNSYLGTVKEMDSFSIIYPDSKYLMYKLWEALSAFKNINDAQNIFSNFSNNNQSSAYGRQVGNIIRLYSTPFKNISLINANTGALEKIILDSTKYNLLIFSASWCTPCHEMIPELKNIYKDLKKNLNFVYISMDEFKYVSNWRKLMKDKAIPWRSLLSSGHVKEIEDKFDAGSLPHMLLVYPNMTVRKIDIRNSKERNTLYQLVKV